MFYLALVLVILLCLIGREKLKKNSLWLLSIIVILISLRFGKFVFAGLALAAPMIFQFTVFLMRNPRIIHHLLSQIKKMKVKKNRDFADVSLSQKQALEILGLEENASPEEITRKYHSLMKVLHPDYNGSKALASLVNKAKERLEE